MNLTNKMRDTKPTDAIMEQAQVFASAWSLVGGPFDSGDGHDEALAAKEELRQIVVGALADLQDALVAVVGAMQQAKVTDNPRFLFAHHAAFVRARELASAIER